MNAEAVIRTAVPADAPSIAALHVRAWQWAYRGLMPERLLASLSSEQRCAMWRRALSGEDSEIRIWLSERNGSLVGFVASGRPREPSPEATAEIYALYQEETVAGTGIGRALFELALDDLRSRGYQRVALWVLDSNSRARRFYERAGLHADGGQKSETLDGHVLRELRYERVLVDATCGAQAENAAGR